MTISSIIPFAYAIFDGAGCRMSEWRDYKPGDVDARASLGEAVRHMPLVFKGDTATVVARNKTVADWPENPRAIAGEADITRLLHEFKECDELAGAYSMVMRDRMAHTTHSTLAQGRADVLNRQNAVCRDVVREIAAVIDGCMILAGNSK